MTALNCIVLADGSAGFVMTDTNTYDCKTGEIYGASSKIQSLPHARAVVACRGYSDNAERVAAAANRLPDFDDMLDRLGPLLTEEFPGLAGFKNKPDHGDGLDVLIMGFSERCQSVAAFVATSEDGFEFQAIPMYLAPTLTAAELAAAGIRMEDDMPVIQDPRADLMRIIEFQKGQTIKCGSEERHVIGGSAILTTVTKRGISQQIARRLGMPPLVRLTPINLDQPVRQPHRESAEQERADHPS